MASRRPQRGGRLLNVLDLKSYLVGNWHLVRTLTDNITGQDGSLHGEAVFVPTDDGLRYDEAGLLSLGSYEDRVSRTYLYTFPYPHRALVSFSDGRPFHELDLREEKTEVEHLCGDDIYRGTITAETPDRWSTDWGVTGPRKDQRIKSTFTRVTG